MNASSNSPTGDTAAMPSPSSTPVPARPSRLARFFDIFIRHAGAIAVDHTHLLPLDRVSGRTGNVAPTPARRCCC